jgi:ElaB/YqjD/DUF883 family membrane-anchored ribosome-binding protein
MANNTGTQPATDNFNPATDNPSPTADNFNLEDAGAALGKTAAEIGDAVNSAESVREQFTEKVGAFKEKVSDNLSGIAEKVHERSDTTQDYLLEKSDKVNSYAHQTIEAANQFGHRAADALDASSGYVKNFDLAETRHNVMETIKQRPEVSIAVAGVFGLLIGLLIGRSSK